MNLLNKEESANMGHDCTGTNMYKVKPSKLSQTNYEDMI
jgi:hypothetical protein